VREKQWHYVFDCYMMVWMPVSLSRQLTVSFETTSTNKTRRTSVLPSSFFVASLLTNDSAIAIRKYTNKRKKRRRYENRTHERRVRVSTAPSSAPDCLLDSIRRHRSSSEQQIVNETQYPNKQTIKQTNNDDERTIPDAGLS
jgi:hypothetical protein